MFKKTEFPTGKERKNQMKQKPNYIGNEVYSLDSTCINLVYNFLTYSHSDYTKLSKNMFKKTEFPTGKERKNQTKQKPNYIGNEVYSLDSTCINLVYKQYAMGKMRALHPTTLKT